MHCVYGKSSWYILGGLLFGGSPLSEVPLYVSVTLRNPIISCATRKRSITCESVTLRNVTAVAVPGEMKL